ncbi:MAG TPA: hypothetical protein VI756_07515 [Blastocatellia bacterium]
MLDDVLLPTAAVETENVALDKPAETVTLVGTVAAEPLPEDRATTAPPVGAGALNVTVACEGVPPATLAGLSEIEESVTGGAARTVSVAV